MKLKSTDLTAMESFGQWWYGGGGGGVMDLDVEAELVTNCIYKLSSVPFYGWYYFNMWHMDALF